MHVHVHTCICIIPQKLMISFCLCVHFTGSTILGHEVEIGWGKVVPLPPTPFYVAPDHIEEMNSFIPDPPTGLPFNARPISRRNRGSSGRGSYNNMPPPNSEGVAREREETFNDDPAIQSFDEVHVHVQIITMLYDVQCACTVLDWWYVFIL